MICRVNSREVRREILGYREFGFGQSVPDRKMHDFRLEFDKTELVELLREEYQSWLADQQADDKLVAEPHPEYFKRLGYPDIQQLMQHPSEFEDAVKSFLQLELLSACLPKIQGNGDSVKWIVNSIDRVTIEPQKVIVSGQAFDRQ